MGTDGKAAAPDALWRTRSAPQRSCLHNGERLISEKHRKRRLTVINGAATSVRSMQLEALLFAELEGKQLPLLQQYFFLLLRFLSSAALLLWGTTILLESYLLHVVFYVV